MTSPRRRTDRPCRRVKSVGQGIFYEFQIGISRARLSTRGNDLDALQMLGNALTRAKRHPEALEVDRKIAKLLPDDPTTQYNLACSYSNLNDVDRALESLERAFQLGYRDISHMMRDSDLKNLRRDRRFPKLVERKWGKRRSR